MSINLLALACVAYLIIGAMVLRGRRTRAIVKGHGKGVSFGLVTVHLIVWPLTAFRKGSFRGT